MGPNSKVTRVPNLRISPIILLPSIRTSHFVTDCFKKHELPEVAAEELLKVDEITGLQP